MNTSRHGTSTGTAKAKDRYNTENGQKKPIYAVASSKHSRIQIIQLPFDDEEEVHTVDDSEEDNDTIVDRILDDTDEQTIQQYNKQAEQLQPAIFKPSKSDFEPTVGVNLNSIALGPNLNMQVNAIGHLRRRKRATK